ncbi:MAG: alpha/beta fold hydrolase, partial [Verrucomicrobiota bacterium]
EWLETPEDHGIRIGRWEARRGRVPCLVVEPDELVGASPRGMLVRKQLEEAGVTLASFGKVDRAVILFHGRKGRKEDLLPIAERFCAVGFRCFLPDLPAHGESPEQRATYAIGEFEASLAERLWQEAREEGWSGEVPCSLWGMSMGGAFVTRAASREGGSWENAVILCSFDQFPLVMEEQAGRLLGPLRGLAIDEVRRRVKRRTGLRLEEGRSDLWAQRVTVPVFLAHGPKDRIISMKRGRSLYEAMASEKKRWVEVPGANHHDILITDFPLYAMMAAWMLGQDWEARDEG